MELRGRRDEDLAGAVALLARVHALDGYPSRWPEDPAGWLRASGSRGAWVVLAGTEDPAAAGDVLGHVALVDRAPGRGLASDAPVEVVRLFVDPASRRRGVGRLLLAAALERADELDLAVDLQVVAASGVVAAYERLGWRAVRRHAAAWTSASGEHPEVVRMVPPPGASGRAAGRVGA